MKKHITLFLVIVMVGCMFIGCISNSNNSGVADETVTTNIQGEVDYSNVKVGMLLYATKIDNGWSQCAAESLMRTAEELGFSEEQVILVENVAQGGEEANSTIRQLVDEGCNLIIGSSSGYTVDIQEAAKEFPDIYFAQFEGESGDNYCAYTCWDVEAIFMGGYAAALMSDVDELGFVAAHPQASVVRDINAWAAGARAANPNATVKVTWTNSWYDPAAEKECTNALLDTGIQAVGQHIGSTAVCEACEINGAYTTGIHWDKQTYGPNSVLTSFVWNWAPVYHEIITQVATGTWTSDVKAGNMADGVACITPWNADIMPQEVIDQCDEMYDAIVSGKYVVMEGPIYDNQGNQILSEGEHFTLNDYISMDFLLENVIGEIR